MKKSTLWILSGVALAVLVAAGVRLAGQRKATAAASTATVAAPALELASSDIFTVKTQAMALGLPVSSAMTMAPPTPKIMAKAGAPESAMPTMAMDELTQAPVRLRGRLANAKKSNVEKLNCASAGVASCESLAKPKQANKANKPPSAMALA